MTKYYFLGIGGIGMNAIARYFNRKGYKVGGYDRVCSQLCLDLQKEGIDIHYTDLKDNIPTEFTDPHETIVIYTRQYHPNTANLSISNDTGSKY